MSIHSVNPLFVYSNHGFGAYSSYSAISSYIQPRGVVSTQRKDPKTISGRAISRVIQSFATSRWYKTSSLELEWTLLQQLKQKTASLVHFLWAERDLGYFPLIKSYYSVPLCCTFHACSDDLPQIFTFRKRLQQLDAAIIMSETQRPFLENCGISSDKIHFIPHGVDTNFFTPSKQEKRIDEFVLLSVGSYRRNFPLLKEVAFKLRKYQEIKIKIVGAQAFSSSFSELDNVEFMSRLSDRELVKAYQSASCLILTIDNATANNALLEGIACGLPVIAERVGGIPEYANEDCAILTEGGNVEQMVEAIVALSKCQFRQHQMSKAARERALELTWSEIAIKTEKLYCSLLDSN